MRFPFLASLGDSLPTFRDAVMVEIPTLRRLETSATNRPVTQGTEV